MKLPGGELWTAWLAVVCRALVGGTFFVAGLLKLIEPVSSFEGAVHSFSILPAAVERPVAAALPWLEIFVGAFCLAGLYTRLCAVVSVVVLAGFIVALAVVIARDGQITGCGCFGRWDFAATPRQLLVRDIVLMMLAMPLARRQRHIYSLDDRSN